MDFKEINSIDELLDVVKSYIKEKSELDTIRKAYYYAKEVHKNDIRKSKEEYMHHPLNVAYILTDLYADSDTLSAALLHDTIHIGHADLQDIDNTFGKDISMLVKGITKINTLTNAASPKLILDVLVKGFIVTDLTSRFKKPNKIKNAISVT